jgi:cysteine desulfurase
MASDYLDHNATTALDERVLEAMQPYLHGAVGNPSSVHRYGRRARAAIDLAREQVASLLGVGPTQVIFTSGGTEANNLALQGVAAAWSRPGHMIVGSTEHPSVLRTARALQCRGWEVDELAVDGNGRPCIERFVDLLRDDTRLVSIMMANNETGVITDMAAVSAALDQRAALLHSDAVQALGKMDVNFTATGVRMMSLSAHKINGPAGAGALLLDRAVDMQPLLHGGGQEFGLRAGSENIAAIVGFGCAVELLANEWRDKQRHMLDLRQRLEQQLLKQLTDVVIFGRQVERLPNTVFFAIPMIDGETLVMALDEDGFAVASGSACSSSDNTPSHVLMAMGVDAGLARCAVRVSLGSDNEAGDIDRFINSLKRQVNKLSDIAALAW